MWVLISREFKIVWRRPGDMLMPLLFFALVVMLFGVVIQPDTGVAILVAPGIVWVAVLLAHLLAQEHLFRSDVEDGTAEQWLLSPRLLPASMLLRVLTHWLVSIGPLIVASPLFALALGLPLAAIKPLLLGLLLGSPALHLIGAIAAALTASVRRGGAVLALLVLPLWVPILIFGCGLVANHLAGAETTAALYALIGLLMLSLTLAPLAIAASLRISLE